MSRSSEEGRASRPSSARMADDRDRLRDALRLYAVTDRGYLREGMTLYEACELALQGGATMLQLREKHADPHVLIGEALQLDELCTRYGVPLIIDDDVDVAREVGCGVHIGQEDTELLRARDALGGEAIIGVSAQTVEQARRAAHDGADYLGVGAVFPTATKPDAVDVSHEMLRRICEAVDIPVVAIGGITTDNMVQLNGTGIAGVAVVSAIFAASDIYGACADLSERMGKVVGR